MVPTNPETLEPRLSRLEGAYEHVATKEDVANVRTEVANVRVEIGDLRTEIGDVRTEIANVRTEIANVKSYVAAAETRLIRWGVGSMGVGFAAMTAIIKLT